MSMKKKKVLFFFLKDLPISVYLEYITSGSKQSLNFRVWGGLVIENRRNHKSHFLNFLNFLLLVAVISSQ